MGHTVAKQCPSCSQNHRIYLKLPLELEDGGIDESADISLNDPSGLVACYSRNGLEKLAEVAGKLQWICPRRQISYSLVARPLVGLRTKIGLARWLCGRVIKEAIPVDPDGLSGSGEGDGGLGFDGRSWGFPGGCVRLHRVAKVFHE